MSKITIKVNNLSRTPYIPAYLIKDIEVGTFIQLIGEVGEVVKEVTESQFSLILKGNKGILIEKTDIDALVMKFNKSLGDGINVRVPLNELVVRLRANELVLNADFRY